MAVRFDQQVSAIVARTRQSINELIIEVTKDTGQELVDATPLGDPALWKRPAPKDYVPGKAKSNWRLGIGAPDQTVTERRDIRQVNGIDQMPEQVVGKRLFLTLSVPYARRLEYGHSTQAPAGMVRLTAIKVKSLLAEAIPRVRK